MKEPTPTIHLVDDEPSVLKAVSRLLRSAGHDISAHRSAQEFLDDHDPAAPGCAIVDLAMPGINGLQLHEEMLRRHSPLPVIFLTGHGDVRTGVKAMRDGAIDFLTKPVNDAELLAAVGRALDRNRADRQRRADLSQVRTRLSLLTPRERQVLPHVVAGKLNKQIAADLGTVEKTIKVHRGRIMEKLDVNSVAALVRLTEKAGIAPAT